MIPSLSSLALSFLRPTTLLDLVHMETRTTTRAILQRQNPSRMFEGRHDKERLRFGGLARRECDVLQSGIHREMGRWCVLNSLGGRQGIIIGNAAVKDKVRVECAK